MKPARQVSGKWLLAMSVGAIIVSVVFVGFAFKALAPASNGTMFGSFFVNEGGYANATSGASGSYNLTLTANSGSGTILFTFLSGNDVVQNHVVTFTNYTIDSNKISMVIGGHTVILPWEDNDTIWNHQYDNNYIASSGPNAPPAEMRGQISASVFGLPSNDYVEFRFVALGGNPVQDF